MKANLTSAWRAGAALAAMLVFFGENARAQTSPVAPGPRP